ncbi:MAG: hypothetical protein E7A86_24285, partial [Bradyrhizobium sp.]|nr:hypothetical protein [Bradyrhizobium sp.]
KIFAAAKKGFVGTRNCFVAAVPTKQSGPGLRGPISFAAVAGRHHSSAIGHDGQLAGLFRPV